MRRGVDKLSRWTIWEAAPGLAALRRYQADWLRYDIAAGVSVAAVAIPVAIAYSQLANLPPVYGLYSSILPLVAYAVFGTSRQLIMAPDAATCAIVAAVVLPLAAHDPARQVSLTVALTMLTGLLCIAAGIARLGFLTNFLARPILAGYLNGIAISIIGGQLGKLFGFGVKPAGIFRTLAEFVSKLPDTHLLTLAVSVAFFVLLRVLKRTAPRLPAPLIAVLLAIVASRFFDLGSHGVALLGVIPAGLPKLMAPQIGLKDLEPLATGAAAIALISFNSAMVTARGFAVKNRYDLDPNKEFIALGFANIGAAALQGFAVSGADSRTAVNDSVGGKSQVTSLVAASLVVAVLLFLTGPLALLPTAVLSAVLVNAALGLFDIRGLARLHGISRKEFNLSIIALLGVVTAGVLPGVLFAVGVALFQLLVRSSCPNDAVLGRVPGMDGYHDIRAYPGAETIPGMVIFRFDAALVFFNADRFKSRVLAVAKAEQAHCFIMDAETIPTIDSTGAEAMAEVCTALASQGVAFALAEAKRPIRQMAERMGLLEQIAGGRSFPTLDEAVAHCSGERGQALDRRKRGPPGGSDMA